MLVGLVPVEAAPVAPVAPRHLPSQAQVASIYDGFAGGSRRTYTNRGSWVRASNCVDPSPGPTAASGLEASYENSAGELPLFIGAEQPSVHVLNYHTANKAKAAFVRHRNEILRCEGSHSTSTETYQTQVINVRRMANARIAHREYWWTDAQGNPQDYDFLRFWVRDGRYLLRMDVQVQAAQALPSKPRLVALTLKTLARLP